MSAKPSAQRVVIVGASDKSDRYANMASIDE